MELDAQQRDAQDRTVTPWSKDGVSTNMTAVIVKYASGFLSCMPCLHLR